jgi:hypothetical protein
MMHGQQTTLPDMLCRVLHQNVDAAFSDLGTATRLGQAAQRD